MKINLYLIAIIGAIIHYFLGYFLFDTFISIDANPKFVQMLIYMLITLPPFFLDLILYIRNLNIIKTIKYSSIFYMISAIIISFLKTIVVIPGGIGALPELTIIPIFLLTLSILFIISKVNNIIGEINNS